MCHLHQPHLYSRQLRRQRVCRCIALRPACQHRLEVSSHLDMVGHTVIDTKPCCCSFPSCNAGHSIGAVLPRFPIPFVANTAAASDARFSSMLAQSCVLPHHAGSSTTPRFSPLAGRLPAPPQCCSAARPTAVRLLFRRRRSVASAPRPGRRPRPAATAVRPQSRSALRADGRHLSSARHEWSHIISPQSVQLDGKCNGKT